MLTLKINIDNLLRNITYLRKKTTSEFCAVVKANAYGHGFNIIKYIDPYVDCFAVSSGNEANAIRRFTNKEIYVLCPSKDLDDKKVIYSAATSNDLLHKRVCVKINTGMNRLGVLPQYYESFLHLCNIKNVSVDSIYTHFSDIDFAPTQYERFTSLDFKGYKRHAAASNFLKLPKEYHLDMVRCGLAMYGYGDNELSPILSAYTEIYNLVNVKRGDKIGYSKTADKDMKVAVLGVGYADSVKRQAQYFYIGDKLCPSVGNICMDMCLVDVSGVKCHIGDKVEILGKNIKGEFVAEVNNTIIYEILTSFGNRCGRIYETGIKKKIQLNT